MNTEEIKLIARRVPYEIFNQGKLALADEIVSPDFVNHSSMPGLATRGPEAVRQLAETVRTAFPDLRYTLEAEIAEGDKVVHRVTARGTNTGSFMGIPPTGKAATWTETHIIRFQGNKGIEHWGEVDLMGIMQQLGLAPAPGQ